VLIEVLNSLYLVQIERVKLVFGVEIYCLYMMSCGLILQLMVFRVLIIYYFTLLAVFCFS
jgi:hypothetical protein